MVERSLFSRIIFAPVFLALWIWLFVIWVPVLLVGAVTIVPAGWIASRLKSNRKN